ncbi:porin [Acidovorax sp. Be4]|uniref:Porin n=1 Tax=Acidovorax bellezanensis TaxID=2976702 RepID=A0ABT2PS00_9BURK|nr:porin [Acidovorax sp. Be4]MCT9813251.1 porin [Acidovorax sp. Be4]
MRNSFVKNTLALAAMAVASPLLFAQQASSSVQLYGIVDAAVRHTNNEGVGANSSLTKMIGGGMSQSRWGINVTEDLGGGLKAIANLENRFLTDSGTTASANYFQQSWLGLQGNYGRLTMGRQYNVLFDLVTSTYASFPYSPYMEAYKPEIGMALGARANNMLKYTAEYGAVRGALQYSFDEKDTTTGASARTAGGYLRYSANGFSAGAAYQNYNLPQNAKVDAFTLGGSYRMNALYVNLGYGQNKLKGTPTALDSAVLASMWGGDTNGGFTRGAATKRDMFKVGFGYQFTPQLNVGAHYFHAKQKGSPVAADNGKADFIVAVADYAFSKRTDAYFGVDYTKVKGGANIALGANGARDRTGITAGLRHRF